MANRKAKIKTIAVSAKRSERNRALRSQLRSSIRKFNDSMAGQGESNTEEKLNEALRRLDKSASKGILHRKTADRKKSRLVASFRRSQTQD